MANKKQDKHCLQEEFFKPYRIKPAEIYVEPKPDMCTVKNKE